MTPSPQALDAERVRRHERLLEGENEVLKLIIERAPIENVLDALVRVAERQSTGDLLASVLLLDRDGVHLRHGAAPSLPAPYSRAIDGIEIGPSVGSCGTAAFLKRPVIVTDILSDPLWDDFRDVASLHGLRACWSAPILSSGKTVLGTFAIYYRHPCEPDAEDEAMISILTRTAALAIEHHRAENEIAESEERFRSLSRCAPLGVFTTDETGAFSYVNPRFIELSGYEYEKTLDYWLESVTADEGIVRGLRQAMANRIEYYREFALTSHAGRHVILRTAPWRSAAGSYLGYVGTLEDTTARVRLRDSIEKSIPCGIAAVQEDGTQSYVNRAFAEMVGWTAEELTGRKAPFEYWPESTHTFAGKPGQYKLQLRRRSGELFDALVNIAPLSSEPGAPSGWVAAISPL